jgi:hypothetical protein
LPPDGHRDLVDLGRGGQDRDQARVQVLVGAGGHQARLVAHVDLDAAMPAELDDLSALA